MASKVNSKPETSYYARTTAERLRRNHNFKYDIGDLVTKYPGCVWEILEIQFDSICGQMYYLSREVGGQRKRWKTCWVRESELMPAFVK